MQYKEPYFWKVFVKTFVLLFICYWLMAYFPILFNFPDSFGGIILVVIFLLSVARAQYYSKINLTGAASSGGQMSNVQTPKSVARILLVFAIIFAVSSIYILVIYNYSESLPLGSPFAAYAFPLAGLSEFLFLFFVITSILWFRNRFEDVVGETLKYALLIYIINLVVNALLIIKGV